VGRDAGSSKEVCNVLYVLTLRDGNCIIAEAVNERVAQKRAERLRSYSEVMTIAHSAYTSSAMNSSLYRIEH